MKGFAEEEKLGLGVDMDVLSWFLNPNEGTIFELHLHSSSRMMFDRCQSRILMLYEVIHRIVMVALHDMF